MNKMSKLITLCYEYTIEEEQEVKKTDPETGEVTTVMEMVKVDKTLTQDEMFTHLHKLASSNNEALDMMQNERNLLRRQLDVISEDFKNLTTAFEIQKNLNTQVITEFNAEKQVLLEENRLLRINGS